MPRLAGSPGDTRLDGVSRRGLAYVIVGGALALATLVAPIDWRSAAYLAAVALGAATLVWGVLRSRRCGSRWAGGLLAAGVLVRVVADLGWMGHVALYGPEVPATSWSTASYGLHYLVLSAGVVALRDHRAPSRIGLLDAGITTAGLLLPAWTFGVEPYLHDGHASTATAAATVGYVACDLLLLACVARLLIGSFLRTTGSRLLAAGLGVLLVADGFYLGGTALTGSTAALPPAYFGWAVFYLLFGAAGAWYARAASDVRVLPAPPPARPAPRPTGDRLTWRRAGVFALVAISAPVFWVIDGVGGEGRELSGPADRVVPAVIVAVLSALLIVRLVVVARVAQARAAELAERELALSAALERQEALQEQLAARALRDPLTGLGNRALLADRLTAALAAGPGALTLLLCDLDGFKEVNDTLGHPVGDELLLEVAARLRAGVPDEATVARLGGDEFAVVLPTADADAAQRLADQIVAGLATPYPIADRQLHVTTSVGVLVADATTTSASDALRDADLALYAAKNAGKNQAVVFTPELRAARLAHSRLVAGLRDALVAEGLRLDYQPVVDLHTGRCQAVEALLRWTDADGRSVPPSQFIPVAEENGLIVPIGAWVLRRACAEAAAWYRTDGVAVAVNVSGVQLADPGFVDVVTDALAAAGLPGAALILEVTESVLVTGGDLPAAQIRERLTRLRAAGVRVAIDDFGTGYSSLAALRQLPVDILKIDKSFIAGSPDTGPADPTFTRAILHLARSLQLTAIAEGIETEEQAAMLRTLGRPMAQGYLFARPAPAAAITAYLDRDRGAAERRWLDHVPAALTLQA